MNTASSMIAQMRVILRGHTSGPPRASARIASTSGDIGCTPDKWLKPTRKQPDWSGAGIDERERDGRAHQPGDDGAAMGADDQRHYQRREPDRHDRRDQNV